MTTVSAAPALAAQPASESDKRVVYLFGAGATHGSIRFKGSSQSLIMPGLIDALTTRMREKYFESYSGNDGVGRLVNDVVDQSTDFEQLITFLEDAPSAEYRALARDLKGIFSNVLRAALADARDELTPEHSALYAVLLDMHAVTDSGECLRGCMTLNYDDFLEHAIRERHDRTVDYGVDIRGIEGQAGEPAAVRVLKLHGSFGWKHGWPIELAAAGDPGLWIPPGIRKAKTEYPFNAIWGAARELLDCDILRIIGCNLGPNDWDLVSLLFTTMHARDEPQPYAVEVIAGPPTAIRIAELFPYLNVRSLLEIPELGALLVSEVLGGAPAEFETLSEPDQALAVKNAKAKITNPFEQWLRLKGEMMNQNLPSIETDRHIFSKFVQAGV